MSCEAGAGVFSTHGCAWCAWKPPSAMGPHSLLDTSDTKIPDQLYPKIQLFGVSKFEGLLWWFISYVQIGSSDPLFVHWSYPSSLRIGCTISRRNCSRFKSTIMRRCGVHAHIYTHCNYIYSVYLKDICIYIYMVCVYLYIIQYVWVYDGFTIHT